MPEAENLAHERSPLAVVDVQALAQDRSLARPRCQGAPCELTGVRSAHGRILRRLHARPQASATRRRPRARPASVTLRDVARAANVSPNPPCRAPSAARRAHLGGHPARRPASRPPARLCAQCARARPRGARRRRGRRRDPAHGGVHVHERRSISPCSRESAACSRMRAISCSCRFSRSGTMSRFTGAVSAAA